MPAGQFVAAVWPLFLILLQVDTTRGSSSTFEDQVAIGNLRTLYLIATASVPPNPANRSVSLLSLSPAQQGWVSNSQTVTENVASVATTTSTQPPTWCYRYYNGI